MSLIVAVLALGAGSAPSASADIGAATLSQWYPLPGLNASTGAQWMRAIAPYGTPPNVVYAGMEAGGVYKSVNGGATWSAFNSGFANPLLTNVRALLTSSSGTTVYAGVDSGIFKSTGGAWQPLAQGPEADPANPKKLNQSVQSLLKTTTGTMLAGVFSGGVYKSGDDGATWSPPPANSGMPASETVYGLTENIPGFVYATAGSGVYLSTNQGSTWTRVSDGIPGSASPITTWAYPQRPLTLFTSTGSNGIYRSVNGGVTWAEINDGLGAVRARGMQIFTSSQGAHVYAATENGLWESLTSNSANPPPPRWHNVTDTGLSGNTIMWSLSAPTIPGAGALGVIAGTQSNGGYFLAFDPPDSDCPAAHTTNTTTDCPRLVDTTPTAGQFVSIQNGFTTQRGAWTGTPILDYAYQWQKCSGTTEGSCSDIPDAQETSYPVPIGDSGDRFRVKVSVTNPAPSLFGPVVRYSAISSAAAASPTTVPGYTQVSPPSISVEAPGETTSPQVGNTMHANDGWSPILGVRDEWFNPAAANYDWQWLRCDGSGNDCNEIPGATSRNYTLTPADGTRDLRVRLRGSNGSGTRELISGSSYDVTSLPAQVAPPLPPDAPGGATKSQAPALSGTAFVGDTIAGSVGGWVDPTTDFLKRWVRCDAAGESCSTILKAASTEPEDGSTYVVRDGDVGSTIRMRVTADVNNDLTPDGLDNHLPHSVTVDTPPSAVVAFRGGAPGGGGVPAPAPGGGPGPDATAPVLSALRLTKTSFVAGKGTVFKLRTSEGGRLRIRITRSARGRKVSGRCRPQTRKNRRAKRCTYDKLVTTITRANVSGDVSIAFSGKVGKRKLAPGTYRATFSVTDAAGNVSKGVALVFRVRRR
jgi:hypothetical protein